jgi:hypothetical protein
LQSEKCDNCSDGKYDCLSKVIRNCELCIRKSDIKDITRIGGNLYFECTKSVDDYIYDEHYAVIKEVDVIE